MKIIIVAGDTEIGLSYVESIKKKSRYVYWVRTKAEASKDIGELLQKGASKVSTKEVVHNDGALEITEMNVNV